MRPIQTRAQAQSVLSRWTGPLWVTQYNGEWYAVSRYWIMPLEAVTVLLEYWNLMKATEPHEARFEIMRGRIARVWGQPPHTPDLQSTLEVQRTDPAPIIRSYEITTDGVKRWTGPLRIYAEREGGKYIGRVGVEKETGDQRIVTIDWATLSLALQHGRPAKAQSQMAGGRLRPRTYHRGIADGLVKFLWNEERKEAIEMWYDDEFCGLFTLTTSEWRGC